MVNDEEAGVSEWKRSKEQGKGREGERMVSLKVGKYGSMIHELHPKKIQRPTIRRSSYRLAPHSTLSALVMIRTTEKCCMHFQFPSFSLTKTKEKHVPSTPSLLFMRYANQKM